MDYADERTRIGDAPDDGVGVEHGDVLMTEDGFIFVVYRSHHLLSATGVLVTDGDTVAESPSDLGVGYRILTDDEVRAHRGRVEAVLGSELDALLLCVADSGRRNVLPEEREEAESYRADFESLTDAARIILAR